MTRRESIRNILIASSGTLFLAGCTEANAIEFLKNEKLLLNNRHLNYISNISEALVPVVSHLGETMGSPTSFIMTMINDCHSSKDISKFATGFDQYKLLMKESKIKIKNADPDKVIEVVKTRLEAIEPQAEMIFFINKIKRLAVRHLKTSQLYMQDVMEYRLIPTTYESCLPA